MPDDVIRSLKESRRFERVSSDEVRDHIDSRWYELVLACDGDEQLAREHVFAALTACHQAGAVPVTELEGEGGGSQAQVICGNDAGDSRPGEKGCCTVRTE